MESPMPLQAPPAALPPAIDQACVFDSNAEAVSLEQLPAAIQLDLKQRAPGLSPTGAAFNASDIGYGPRTRFIAAARLNTRYVVAYEHGGRGYHVDLLTYDTSVSDLAPRDRRTMSDKPGCGVLTEALNAPLPAQPYTGPYW